jgi:hypothetical protein
MVNHIFLARLFLIGLAVVGIYTVVSEKSPDEVTLIPCIFHSVTDVPCPGCGMTRACLALTHAHFAEAWRYHPFSFLVAGLAVGVTFFPLRLRNAWTYFSLKTRNLIIIFGIVFCLSVWIFKLIN